MEDNMYNLSNFTGMYPVSKTLRFELIPVGKTLENINKNGVITKDTDLADSYRKMKKTLDSFHKAFIDDCMQTVKLCNLSEYNELYNASADEKATEAYKNKFDAVKQALRKEITKAFSEKKDVYSILFKKELIQKELESWINKNAPELYFDDAFKNFTTYFTGYNENRKNMYSEEEKSTAVAYRLINENLPRFIDNVSVFEKISGSGIVQQLQTAQTELADYILNGNLADMFALNAYELVLTQSGIDAYNTVIGGLKEGDRKIQGLNEYINLYNQKNPNTKLPKFKPLFKQILSDRVSASWLPESFESADDMLNAVNSFIEDAMSSNMFDNVVDAAASINLADANKVYISNDASVSSISMAISGHYGLIRDALDYYYENTICPDYTAKYSAAKSDSAREKIEKAKSDFVSGTKYHSAGTIESAMAVYLRTVDFELDPMLAKNANGILASYFSAEGSKKLSAIKECVESTKDLFNVKHEDGYKLSSKDTKQLKLLLDTV
ncbi:MAG: type V CRISPR-associated protein Cas12a/Cpf1, partial [Clostridia bacterium]|nr:type V CRISPR-associated protein Cas12a/Cpf1 [Clostridia bacterium]